MKIFARSASFRRASRGVLASLTPCTPAEDAMTNRMNGNIR